LAALGRPAYINLGREGALPAERTVEAMRQASWRVLDAAYAAGVRWIDVARSYGLAEEFLAGWLAERRVVDLTISSKWGYAYVGGWRMDADVHEVKQHSLAQFSAQWAQTRALLGDKVALYQVHSLTLDSPLFTDKPLLEALAELGSHGVRVGLSTSGSAQAHIVERALALEVAGRSIFTAVQSTWNVLEPSVGRALQHAHGAGILVLVKEVLANGRLAAQAPAPLAEIAQRHAVTPDAVAIAAALRQPWADTVLLGPVSTEQLSSNLDALHVELDEQEQQRLDALAEPAHDYWRLRGELPWQ